jgi:hypothetical protein
MSGSIFHHAAQADQFMVSKTVAVGCRDPELAVTVTVALTGVGVGDGVFPPPLQALASPRHAQAAIKGSQRNKCRLLRPKESQITTASTGTGSSVTNPGGRAEAVAEAVIVSVTFAAWPDVIEDGLKEHEVPAGSPEQMNVTAELKPFCGVTVSVTVPCPPVFTVSEVGDALSENEGGGRLMV